jgi:hypothetical protein
MAFSHDINQRSAHIWSLLHSIFSLCCTLFLASSMDDRSFGIFQHLLGISVFWSLHVYLN